MRRLLSLTITAGVMMLSARVSSADVTAQIADSSGDPHRLTVANAASDVPFSFGVFLTNTFAAVSAQLKVQNLTAAGVFELVARVFDTSAGWDAGGGATLPFTSPDDLTRAPGGNSSQDIGTMAQDLTNGVSEGTSHFMTIEAKVKAGTPAGVYRLNLADIVVGDTGFDPNYGTAGADYIVQVGVVQADMDQDGDVDLNDFTTFQGCFNGPNQPPSHTGCEGADLDGDHDVDLNDFTVFQGCFNGPNQTPNC